MNEIEQQIARLDALIAADPADADAIYRRGALHWKLGHTAAALTDFNRAADLDPAGPAPAAARTLNQILAFSNPDLYNP